MKKLYAIIFIFSLSIFSVIAQDNLSKKFKIITGVNLASQFIDQPEFKGSSAFTTNLHIAGFIDLAVSKKISFQTGLSFSGKGAEYDYKGTGVDPTFGPYNFTYKGSTNIMYLEVPLNGVYKIKNIYFGAGPYFAYALSGKKKINTIAFNSLGTLNLPADEGKVEIGNSQTDDIRRIDYGVNCLIGYQFEDGFNVGANYGFGLYNAYPINNQTRKNRVISVSVGYSF